MNSGRRYHCPACGLALVEGRLLGIWFRGRYRVTSIGDEYSLARPGIAGRSFSAAELRRLAERVYPDAALAAFAGGDFERLRMPSSVLAQILLEQLRETCTLQVNGLRRARGPALQPGGNRFPQDAAPRNRLQWLDRGNLFLTTARIVFPSDTFTFIRMDRKLVGLQTFADGIAVQRKGEDSATYFVGCGAHQAALVAAYIQGKVAALRQPVG
ncbi:MAG: hypothetical protein ACE5G8_04620 [Anaerolineae bacterium]